MTTQSIENLNVINIKTGDNILLTINNEEVIGTVKEIKKGLFDFTENETDLIYKQSIIIDLETTY